MNAVQPMISTINVECNSCSVSGSFNFTSKPVWRSPIGERIKSHLCDCTGYTLAITGIEYTASLEIQLQDIEKITIVLPLDLMSALGP